MKILIQSLRSYKTFSLEIWFLSCFSVSDWMMISSVNVIINLFYRGELKDNACYRVSRQMDNWKLPHVNSSLNVWGIALWQHTIFTEVTDRTLWSIKYSRSAVFLRIRLCENKRKRSLVRIASICFQCFCVSNKKESDWKKLTPTQHLPNIGCGTLPPTFLKLIKTNNASSKIEFQDMCGSKHTLKT